MADVIVIGCRHPVGIVLEHDGVQVTLAGQNQNKQGIVLLSQDDYGETIVDASYWAAWKKANAGFAPLETGMIFEAKNQSEAKSKAKELKKEKTGHEPMPQVDGTGKIESAE
jgi:PHD/YefM family antitoxin component YafN of YafNO toxin-antitoxin module